MWQHKAGQSMIESCIVIILACLIFMGLFQLSQIYAASEFLNYSATRGVRAKTVGFNEFMVWKTARVGSIPNAGKMVTPEYTRTPAAWGTATPSRMWTAWRYLMNAAPASEQYEIERARIPLYLGTEHYSQLAPLLDYEDWDTIRIPRPVEHASGIVSMELSQDFPLKFPFHRAFYAADSVVLSGRAEIENHSSLYLQD